MINRKYIGAVAVVIVMLAAASIACNVQFGSAAPTPLPPLTAKVGDNRSFDQHRSGPSNERPWETPYRQLITLRGRSGRVLSPEEAELAAIETRETLTARLARSDRNTRALAIALEEKQVGTVSSPWLSSHVHHDRIDAIGTGGRFVYLRFDPQRLPSERLATFDRALAIAAARAGVPLMVATTFGLSLPHVCLLAHPTEGLTLRISPGSGDDFSAALANLLAHLLDGT